MTVRTKMAFALLGVALAASACGSTASAASSKTAAPISAAQMQANEYCQASVRPPKGDTVDDPNNGPTAKACWADGMFVGDGPLAFKQIVFADKQVNLAVSMITPQQIRQNPTLAEHDFVGSVSQYASPQIVSAYWQGMQSGATAGDTQINNAPNSADPTGIVAANFHVVPIGVKTIPNSIPRNLPEGPFTQAKVEACADGQIYGVSKTGKRLPGLEGQTGYTAWTDTFQKTAAGWQMIGTTASKAVPSCN